MSFPPLAFLLPDLVCAIICAVAVYTDFRTQRIPNWLTLSGFVFGLVFNTVLFCLQGGLKIGFMGGFAASFGGSLLLFIVFGVFGLVGFVGMGDAKLMAAVGALLRWPLALWALAYVAVIGGLLAVFFALAKGALVVVIKNIFRIGAGLVRKETKRQHIELHRIPYALAIFLGSMWAVGARYFPWLRIL
ncbi:MAG: A24 family peptidase [Pseudomonadota bacterium]